MSRARDILFRIFYSTTFTINLLLLVIFCAVSPADKIYQSYKRDRLVDIFILTGAYVLTGLIALFLYSSRLYTNRSMLRDIPKTFLPIEKDDLPGKRVFKLVEECMARCAVVAYHAKPRAKRIEVEVPGAGKRVLALSGYTKLHRHEHQITSHEQALLKPKWGTIAHPGWHSPAAAEMPDLEYAKVVDELVDLIEAKAVSLAPADPTATPTSREDGVIVPDPAAVEVLTRGENMGMRQYLSILTDLGVVPDNSLIEAFTTSYEKARFGALPLSEPDFQTLMRLFAELLRSMQPINPSLISFDDDDINNDHNNEDGESTRRHDRPASSKSSTFSSSSSIIHNPNASRGNGNDHLNPNHMSQPPRRVSEDSAPSMSEDELDAATYYTFTSRPAAMSRRTGANSNDDRSTSRPSLNQAHTRFFSARSTRQGVRRRTSQGSMNSSRTGGSRGSGESEKSNGSVIRLRRDGDAGDLPYVFERSG